jgi:hypothetical protein
MNVSPEYLKNSANYMSNMDKNEFERAKKMAGGQIPQDSADTSKNVTNSSSSSSQSKSSSYPKIEALKNEGNDFFKKNLFDQASNMYLKVISRY